jgi:hypothetical protein
MPTVIDALVVRLGFDASQFSKTQKEAALAFLKTRDESTKTGKAIEDAGKRSADGRFIHADIAASRVPAGSFDAVSAFYAMTHVPCNQHAVLLRRSRTGLSRAASSWRASGRRRASGPAIARRADAVQPSCARGRPATGRSGRIPPDLRRGLPQDNEDSSFLWITAQRS